VVEGADGSTWRWVRDGWGRRSVVALLVLCVCYGLVGWSWRNLFDPSQGMDWLLAGIWVFMSLLLVWRLDLRRDGALLLVGAMGGAVIEWWGTTSQLWHYFTAERPPLWILPAWPVAAMAVDRVARIGLRVWPFLGRLGRGYWVLLPAFVLLMTRFVWPRVDVRSTQVVILLMIGVTFVGARPRRDVLLFVAGASLGLFLEYWGTSRRCWTYYTEQVPPVEAVLAHGFASVAFARAWQGVSLLFGLVGLRPPVGRDLPLDAVFEGRPA
jgi:hypothetical protein